MITVLFSCKKDKVALIGTVEITNIQSTGCKASIEIIDAGDKFESYGWCWNTTGNPTTADNMLEFTEITDETVYTGDINGLVPETKYYLSAFIKYNGEIVYSSPQEITTQSLQFTTSEIKSTSFKITTNLTAGGNQITAFGFCWNTTGEPTVADSKLENPEITNSELLITNMQPNTKYYVKAYIQINSDYIYSTPQELTTPELVFNMI